MKTAIVKTGSTEVIERFEIKSWHDLWYVIPHKYQKNPGEYQILLSK